jgi:hypothetical protein
VTFILQKNKSNMPGFDFWYNRWRERLKADPVLCWIVESRNRITKQGDLDTESYNFAYFINIVESARRISPSSINLSLIETRLRRHFLFRLNGNGSITDALVESNQSSRMGDIELPRQIGPLSNRRLSTGWLL